MKSRLWLVLLIGLLCLGVLPAMAQDHDEMLAALNCLDLSEADCAIVTESVENLKGVNSFALDFTFKQANGNVGDMALPGLDTSTDVTGSGTVAIDHAAMSEDDPLAGISIAMNVTTTVTNSDGAETNDINFVIADGNIYIQNSDTGEWSGTSVEGLHDHPEVLGEVMGGMSIMGMPLPIDQMMDMGGAMGGAGMEDIEIFAMHLSDLLGMPDFLSQERLPDETVNGENTNVFALTADLGVLLQSEDVQTGLADAMAQAGGDTDNPMAGQMAMMLPVIFQNTSGAVTFTRWLGADDLLPRRLTLDAQLAIDLFGGASGNNTPIPPITLGVTLDAHLSGINDTPTPTAPEGATVVPADEFFGVDE